MDQYAAVVAVPTVMQNFLHPYQLPPVLLAIWVRGAVKDNRGTRTDNLSGCHPIWTIGAPPPSSPISAPNALSATTLLVYPGLGQAPNDAGLHTEWRGSMRSNNLTAALL